ncbi:hypothetical protein [Rhodanobacter sp. PCA2]|uniref:hypothetical protein n=1 Tax=Rhodanobacter sp. PCA2 TaxID=2006117 RepID=UPI0015E73A54|nr:hypothetical protein [Rhodanobacter sp. PCA2]MBA2077897.1 hypothetical protein [Rhodanobacter sp. PCA2]
MSHAPRQAPYRTLFVFSALLLITAAFWPALPGGYIFDDYPIFAENPAIHVSGWHWAEWHRVWTWSHINIQRPLAMLSYALNYALGNGIWGFKFTNLLIHLFNTVLVLLLARRLLAAGWPAPAGDDDKAHWRSLGGWALGIALAWAIHPLQVSAVMYVVQRMELMGFSFVLLALLTYWRARQLQLAGRRGWPWLLLCGVLVVVGYGAKETVVLVLGYALLIELTLLHFAAGKPALSRAWKVFYTVGCLCAATAFLFYLLPHYATAAAYAGRDFTAWQRELTQLRVLPLYLYWSVLPLPSHLVFYYDNFPASTGWLHPATTLYGGLFLLVLIGVAVAIRKRRPLLALGIAWFFMANALTSAPIALELVFEHRNYPALFGVVLALADLVQWITQRSRSRVFILVACVLILNLGVLTALRAATWGSKLLLATTLVDYNPGSARAAQDLARSYMAMSGGNPDSPLYSLSIQQLERATKLSTDSPLAEEALLLEAANNHGLSTQLYWDSFKRKLRTRPLIPDTYLALNKLMTERTGGNVGIDAHQLAEAYAIALSRTPKRASLHAEYAELAGAVLHDAPLAIDQWQQTLVLVPDVRQYATRLADYLVEQQRLREAVAVIDKAMELRPDLHNDPALLVLQTKARQPHQETMPAH